MNKTPDGNYWWLRITGLTPGTEYAFQYLVDGTLKIADPYAEKSLIRLMIRAFLLQRIQILRPIPPRHRAL